MRLLIVEDEPAVAQYIKNQCIKVLNKKVKSIHICYSLDEASDFINKHSLDLCLLDLNLNGQDGYELLQLAVSSTFPTIIISAYINQAPEAFKYGVLDFIPKPFKLERLKQAFELFSKVKEKKDLKTEYISLRKNDRICIIKTADVLYFKAARIYVDAYMSDGSIEILNKTMNHLSLILPSYFFRCHRSYIINIASIKSYEHASGGTYSITMKDGNTLPLSRQKYKTLQTLLNY